MPVRRIPRRTFIKGITLSSLLPLLGSNLIGCSDDSDRSATVAASFRQGVASGDPLADAVIIWTRALPDADPGPVRVDWQVATDEAFADVVAEGSGITDASVDYTVKVDVQGLEPATRYFYRFSSGDSQSPLGRTRTLPVGALSAASFAVVSCSNHPFGYFNVYREVAASNFDAVLHLGDYIYEYEPGTYTDPDIEAAGRVAEPPREIVALEDYRGRYAQYRSDPDLQDVHAAHPFIVVWDDHEITNNSWRNGAENHQPDTEGDYQERLAAAIQAWYEWLPVRPPASEREIIYRDFAYGDLVNLLMLDTRIIGRDEQFLLSDFTTADVLDSDAARAAIDDSSRSLLGARQLDWLKTSMTDSSARWQVLGQQVLMGRYELPAQVLVSQDPALIFGAVNAAGKAPEDRSPEEQALLDDSLPLNFDAWDGYRFERDDVLNFAHSMEKRLVVLAGDTHNAWATQLTTADGAIAGVEFGTPSVTSPGFDGAFGLELAGVYEGVIGALIPDLKYSNLRLRGYLRVNFTRQDVTAEWQFVSSIKDQTYTLLSDEARQISVAANDLRLEA